MSFKARNRSRKPSASFWLLLMGIIGIALYSHISLRQTQAIYEQTEQVIHSNSATIRKIELPDVEAPLFLSDPQLVRPGKLWGLTSRSHPLPEGFEPDDLVDTAVAHGDSGQPMRVSGRIEGPLAAMFAAAENDGVPLMLSSAYRSVDDQQKLYDEFVAKQGQAMADTYVAKPGTSEHHIGIAVDIASASTQCEADSDKCSLSQAATDWLDENAARFGFIVRYPEGKQPLTGVAFEPWHYRYVGVPLARALVQSGLTLDEAVEQMAPGLKPKR